jgi:hypothetical protein
MVIGSPPLVLSGPPWSQEKLDWEDTAIGRHHTPRFKIFEQGGKMKTAEEHDNQERVTN